MSVPSGTSGPSKSSADVNSTPRNDRKETTPTQPSSPIIGLWKLIGSSEDPSTPTGVPSYIVWETTEFTEGGVEVTSYKHERSPEIFKSETKYKIDGDKLTRIAQVLTTDWRFHVQSNSLEIRDGTVFEKYERVSDAPEQPVAIDRKGEPFREGDDLVSGFRPLRGNVAAGVEVYVQGVRGIDGDPPKFEYTILNPSVTIDGEVWMLVRTRSGAAEHVFRGTAENSGLYWVK